MKKIFYVLGLCTLVLGACDGKEANAQMQQEIDAGSPNGTNMLMLEESYTVSTPAATPAPQTNEQMEPLPGDPDVEVAPQPATANTSSTPQSQPNNQGAMEEVIEESVTTTQD